MVNDDNEYVWIRFRTCHSSGYGAWQWREFAMTKAAMRSKRTQNTFFEENYAEAINDEQSTQSEHWRGIDWEIVPVPQHIVEKEIEYLANNIKHKKSRLARWKRVLLTLPVADMGTPKKECMKWPRCGCLRQGRHKDCRAPYKPVVMKNG